MRLGFTAYFAGLMLAIIIIVILVMSGAYAHSWYDFSCCDRRHCAEIDEVPVKVQGGYRLQDGSFFPNKMLKESRDSNWHACKIAGSPVCLYAPMAG
tara:strand:+ start:747 stop:1037 length:291 start_codon:yes stop_codon:yes gene_type:complete